MRPEDFDFIAKMLKDRSGLVISRDKAYLLESRLTPVARKRGLKGLDDLVATLRTAGEDLLREVTEAMTTNESFFFRDIKPFDQFKAMVLPQILANRAQKKSFRIWSAASSSGQEAYSLAMILKEEGAKLAGWKIEIVGTDISTEMLEKAKAGLYSQFEVQRGLPIQYLVKYFKKTNEMWQIDSAIRAMVQFREYNLLHDLKTLGQFDVVFCRNVLIYFDQPTKSRVLDNISKIMPDDGLLYLGGAETVLGISDKFKPVPEQRGIYSLTRPGGAASAVPGTGLGLKA
ncbi:MAG: protein-glutamate O-methyltransferase CheR [Magnetospirillum sp.]